jgi:hypothetical protein
MRAPRCFASFAFVLAVAACSSSPSSPTSSSNDPNPSDPTRAQEEQPRPDGRGEIVVGLQSEDIKAAFGIDVEAIEVRATIDGAAVATDAFAIAQKPLPHETRFTAPSSAPEAKLEVEVVAFGPENIVGTRDAGPPMVRRLAATRFVPKKTKLLRLRLEQRCVQIQMMGGMLPFYGPTCNAPETCVGGKCAPSAVAVDALEPYSKGWPTAGPDPCKPAQAGAAEVTVGTGESDFRALAAGETLTPVCGPQGGTHIWISARMKNLKQLDSITTVSATQPGTGKELPASAFVYSYAKDGDACALTGLRLQFGAGGQGWQDFLGKPLDVKVEVAEQGGAKASAVAHVTVAGAIDDPWQRCAR